MIQTVPIRRWYKTLISINGDASKLVTNTVTITNDRSTNKLMVPPYTKYLEQCH